MHQLIPPLIVAGVEAVRNELFWVIDHWKNLIHDQPRVKEKALRHAIRNLFQLRFFLHTDVAKLPSGEPLVSTARAFMQDHKAVRTHDALVGGQRFQKFFVKYHRHILKGFSKVFRFSGLSPRAIRSKAQRQRKIASSGEGDLPLESRQR